MGAGRGRGRGFNLHEANLDVLGPDMMQHYLPLLSFIPALVTKASNLSFCFVSFARSQTERKTLKVNENRDCRVINRKIEQKT